MTHHQNQDTTRDDRLTALDRKQVEGLFKAMWQEVCPDNRRRDDEHLRETWARLTKETAAEPDRVWYPDSAHFGPWSWSDQALREVTEALEQLHAALRRAAEETESDGCVAFGPVRRDPVVRRVRRWEFEGAVPSSYEESPERLALFRRMVELGGDPTVPPARWRAPDGRRTHRYAGTGGGWPPLSTAAAKIDELVEAGEYREAVELARAVMATPEDCAPEGGGRLYGPEADAEIVWPTSPDSERGDDEEDAA